MTSALAPTSPHAVTALVYKLSLGHDSGMEAHGELQIHDPASMWVMDHQPSIVTLVVAAIMTVLVLGLAGPQPNLCTASIAAAVPCKRGLVEAPGLQNLPVSHLPPLPQ